MMSDFLFICCAREGMVESKKNAPSCKEKYDEKIYFFSSSSLILGIKMGGSALDISIVSEKKIAISFFQASAGGNDQK